MKKFHVGFFVFIVCTDGFFNQVATDIKSLHQEMYPKKEIYYVGLEPFRSIYWSLSNVTYNTNQITKHVNQTGVIYKNDIQAIMQDVDKLSREV